MKKIVLFAIWQIGDDHKLKCIILTMVLSVACS